MRGTTHEQLRAHLERAVPRRTASPDSRSSTAPAPPPAGTAGCRTARAPPRSELGTRLRAACGERVALAR